MTRGRILFIDRNEILYESLEFNGDMYTNLESGNGGRVIQEYYDGGINTEEEERPIPDQCLCIANFKSFYKMLYPEDIRPKVIPFQGGQAKNNLKYKQIIIVRKDLQLSPRKLAAQFSHASMAFLTTQIRGEAKYQMECYTAVLSFGREIYENWINDEFTKCILEAGNKAQLLKAKRMAEDSGMEEGTDFFLIWDHCHTELKPEEIDSDGNGRTLTS